VLDLIGNSSYATWVRESWGWPWALTLHAFGTAIVVGLIFIIGLRLVGLYRTVPYTSLNRLIPVIWTGVVVQVYSGVTLWTSKPGRYLSDGPFVFKFSFVIIGIVLTVYFQKVLKQEAPAWEAAGKVSARGTRFVAFTALAWAAVLVGGRLTAYLGSLYG
jgi:hypothetical protein